MPAIRSVFVTAVMAMFVVALWPVEFVRSQAGPVPPPTGTGFIAGQVVDSVSGRPVTEAMVRIYGRTSGAAAARGVPTPNPVIVDAQGRFFFGALAAGLYTVEPSKAGYLLPRAATTVDLSDAERILDVRLPLARMASLSGALRDDAGDPVVGTDVIAFRRSLLNGRPFLAQAGRTKSDDRGAYRIGGLSAGDYVVCACSRDPNPFDPVLLTTLASEPVNLMSVAMRALAVGADVVVLDDTLRTYPPTLYPDSPTIARAQRVTLAPGDEKTAVDIRLALVRAARVSGRVMGATRALQADALRLVPAADADAGVDLMQLPPMLVQTDGRFDFASVPPGSYRLIATQREGAPAAAGPSGVAMGFVGARGASPPPTGVPARGPGAPVESPLWANELIAVPPDGISGLVVTLRPATPINGHVEFAGSAPPAQTITNMIIGLQAAGLTSSAANFTSARVAPDRSFTLPGVAPGRYSIASLSGGPLAVDSVVVGGVDMTDLAIDVGDRSLGEIVMTFTSAPLAALSITTAAPGATRPADGTSAVLFPADRKYWTDPAASRRRLRAVPLTLKGAAVMADLPAGDYFVALASGDEVQDWQEAGRLDALSRRAQRVTLASGEQRTLAVRR